MSEPEQVQEQQSGVHLPKPWFPSAVKRDENGIYQPVDPFHQSTKLFAGTAFILGGMQLRRQIQSRKGSQRPGTQRYVDLFRLTKRELVGYPIAVGIFSFLHDCFMNVYEEETPLGDFVSSGVGSVIGLSVAGSHSVPRTVALSFGIGCFYGFARWAGGFEGLGENSYAQTKQAGKIRAADDTATQARSDRQGFWEVVYRRPLSQTVEELGEGRGILKP